MDPVKHFEERFLSRLQKENEYMERRKDQHKNEPLETEPKWDPTTNIFRKQKKFLILFKVSIII